jgi:hypothetical protein
MRIDIITADTGPLIHLAQIGMLDILKKIGKVHVPDLVVLEASVSGKPGAAEIVEWLVKGNEDGTINIATTTTGELLRLARIAEPGYKIKDGGELAIRDWLIESVENTELNSMVIYEYGKVPRLIENHDTELSSAVLTTRAFLSYCESIHLVEKADLLWERLVKIAPTINPKVTVSLYGRLAEEGMKP